MLRALEIAWLMITLCGAAMAFYKLYTESLATAGWFFLLMLISLVIWLIRRKQRIRQGRYS